MLSGRWQKVFHVVNKQQFVVPSSNVIKINVRFKGLIVGVSKTLLSINITINRNTNVSRM